MRNLELNELNEVSGGELLFAPGEISIAVTDNTLVVISGTAEAASLVGALGNVAAAFGAGFAIGMFINDNTQIDEMLSDWVYKMCMN